MMTRQKYETLSLQVLKDLAKARGLKGVSTLRKGPLIDRMVEEDMKEEAAKAASGKQAPQEEEKKLQKPKKAAHDKETAGEKAPAQAKRGHAEEPHRRGRPRKKPQAAEASADARTPAVRTASSERTPAAQTPPDAQTPQAAHSSASAAQTAAPQTGAPQNAAPQNTVPQNAAPAEVSQALTAEKAGQADAQTPAQNDLLAEAQTKPENKARGILEVMPDGFGFLRSQNFLPGENDVYVSPSQIRRFSLKTGDMVTGFIRTKTPGEKFGALLYVESVNDLSPDEARRRPAFESMTPTFPCERIRLERPDGSIATRIVDLISPIGKGQRGMIVSPPKAGKTTLLKDIARSILRRDPDANLMILLIDERPEEVTDMKESVSGRNVEIIYSTFDEMPEHHKRVSEMVIERAKRLVEHKKDVIILLDSITRLARAYNVLVPPSGRTLSGGLDPTALYMPKRFFGAARNMREGGSLTILATALVDTGSKMDDVVYEEFKGTGNMELILDRKLQERRIFPAIDIVKSGTRREDLLLTPSELEAVNRMRRSMNGMKSEEAVEAILRAFAMSNSNDKIINAVLSGRLA